MTEAEQRARVVEIARSFIRVPYVHMGRATGGMDCVGFLLECFERAGVIPHHELAHYPEDWAMHREDPRYLREMEAAGAKRVEREAKPADLAMYRWGRSVSHGALVLAWPLVIHAYKPEGLVTPADATNGILASLHPDGKPRFAGIWSFWD